MIQIDSVKLPIDSGPKALREKVLKILRVPAEEMIRITVLRRSLDARAGRVPEYVYNLKVSLKNEESFLRRKKLPAGVRKAEPEKKIAYPNLGKKGEDLPRPIVVGFGPAGMFCALYLARCGLKPLIIERGEPVEERGRTVETFWKERRLDPESNVQFGEGGAGTFSDGKLNTLIKDREGYGRTVLKEMVLHGAPEEILTEAKPHIGTDRLRTMVKSIREEILSLGGKIRFRTRMVDLVPDPSRPDRLAGLIVESEGNKTRLDATAVFLGIGHSARDTFLRLNERDIPMEAKAFAMGLRIEHLQKDINEARYHEYAPLLGAADYKLTHTAANGHGVYSFCMCPGGTVVASASEEGGFVTNGMSCFARDGKNANSALIVTVTPEDARQYLQKEDHPRTEDGLFDGMYFQRILEQKAFRLGGSSYRAPVQRVEDFHLRRITKSIGRVEPTASSGYTPADLWEILPEFMGTSLDEALRAFEGKIQGFDHPDAILTGIESRTSSPVRILRDPQSLMSRLQGLYPIGEGAGYAGGIMSAAIDGLKAAVKYSGTLVQEP